MRALDYVSLDLEGERVALLVAYAKLCCDRAIRACDHAERVTRFAARATDGRVDPDVLRDAAMAVAELET